MQDNDLLEKTVTIVSAHIGFNTVEREKLPDLIRSVYGTLQGIAAKDDARDASEPVPAVPIKRSVFGDYLICLEDGKKLKMLKRHLKTAYGMEPDEYRARWGLPRDYPMVAPNYAMRRSALAMTFGLGKKRAE